MGGCRYDGECGIDARLAPLIARGNDAVDDAQHPPHDLGPAGEQKAQWKRGSQHPLAQGLPGQYFVNQHATLSAIRRASQPGQKPLRLQLKATRRSARHDSQRTPQEAVFETAASEVILEFAMHIGRQFPALLR